MNLIKIGITAPILNIGETLKRVSFLVSKNVEFIGETVYEEVFTDGTLITKFNYQFREDVIFSRITLTIEVDDGGSTHETDIIVSEEPIVNGVNEISNLLMVYPATIDVNLSKHSSTVDGDISISITQPKFFIGNATVEYVKYEVFDVDYNMLFSITKYEDMFNTSLYMNEIDNKAVVIVEASYGFDRAVYQPKARKFIQISEIDTCNFTIEKTVLSPTIDNRVKIVIFYGDTTEVKYYVIDPITGDILYANIDSTLSMLIPSDSVKDYKEVDVIVHCKTDVFGYDTGRFRCSIKE